MLENVIPVVMPRYCELDSFGIEVVNTISNGGFWLAAFLAFRHARPRVSPFVTYAVSLLVVVGLCSGLFHALHTRPLLVLDAAPLYLLVLSLGYWALARSANAIAAVLMVLAIVAGAVAANALTIGTSVHVASRHGVAVLAFAGVAFWVWRQHPRAGGWLAVGVGLYAVALVAKIVDLPVCPTIPIGTHWLWHLLGAAGAYAALRGVMLLDQKVR